MNNRVPLPAGATLGKAFEYGLDINIGTYGSPFWQVVRRMSGWAPTYPKTTTDVATYDDLGAPNEDVTGRGFAAAFSVQANRIVSTGLYLPEIEAIMAAAKAKGEAAVIDVRFYHKPEFGTPNPNDAGRASVTVEATRSNTGNTGTEVLAVTLSGKGAYEPIPNPFLGWDVTEPTITSIMPPAAGDGDLVTVTGTGLLGATAVTVDGDPVEHVSINGSTLILVLPTGDAGEVPVRVTTPGGISDSFTYERGA